VKIEFGVVGTRGVGMRNNDQIDVLFDTFYLLARPVYLNDRT